MEPLSSLLDHRRREAAALLAARTERTRRQVVALLWAVTTGYVADLSGVVRNPRGEEIRANLIGAQGQGYPAFSRRMTRDLRAHPGEKVSIKVHRLVAFLKFGGAILCDGVEVRHVDGDSTNNAWDNIEIGSRQQNELDKPLEQRRAATRHARAAQLATARSEVLFLNGN